MTDAASPTIDLRGRTAVVTGASRGIGLAVAATLVGAGARVMLSSRKQDALDAAVAELGPAVRVNAIAPGLVQTDMARALVETHGEALSASLPTRRLGRPADIAAAALWLVSDQASWVTGQTFVLDGGALVS